MPLDSSRALQSLRKLDKILAHPLRQLSPEGVHKLRTRCSRVESTIRSLALEKERKGTQLLEAIELIRKKAGKMRDADVLTSLAVSLQHESSGEALIQLVEELGARHARFTRKLEE
jgi:CHAD domain-containing protein